jgi:hypothetical protein
VTTLATSRAPAVIVPSYLRPTVPEIAVPNGSRRVTTLLTKVVARALSAYSPQRAADAIWMQAHVTPWPTSTRRRSPPWTSASRLDAGLDARDGRGAIAGDVLNAAGDFLADNKFGLSVASILSVFAKFTV